MSGSSIGRALVVVAAAGVLVFGVSLGLWASDGFEDVPDDNVFHDDIAWLAQADVTRGCNPPDNTEFCPDDDVTRQQMAAFMHRLATNRVVDAASVDGHTVADIVALSGGDGEGISVILERLEALEARVDSLETENAALAALLAGVSRQGDTLVLEEMNLQIVNGQGGTESANGLGNIIVGYNEDTGAVEDRGGSHNVVVGTNHTYASFGGLVVGEGNNIIGQYATVTGGASNTASGLGASVAGGFNNVASGSRASTTGGAFNIANGIGASVSGGQGNEAAASQASVSGGLDNTASGSQASISGGFRGSAEGDQSSVSGGGDNTASGTQSSISGGAVNEASGGWSSVLGGDGNAATATRAAVSGGISNTASEGFSSVSGGIANTASGANSSVLGGNNNTADQLDECIPGCP